ncbi:MAG: ArsA family ATPase [Pseudomonadota bacterium]
MFQQPLVLVSGKGGVGKTLIASALADLSARRRRTVLVSFDSIAEQHPVFEVPLSYEPVEAARNLAVMRVQALPAIREYVRRKVPLSGLYDAFLGSSMFRDFAEAAPGFEELMCLGKLYDLATDSHFEQVIVDAPATGHLKTLLDVPAATLQAVLVGPLNHNARKIQDLLLDPERTRTVLVTLAEEMAIREAAELAAFCADRRMETGPVVVNQRVTSPFSDSEIERLLGLGAGDEALATLRDCARDVHERSASQAEALTALGSLSLPSVEVPRVVDHEPGPLLDAVVRELEASGRG